MQDIQRLYKHTLYTLYTPHTYIIHILHIHYTTLRYTVYTCKKHSLVTASVFSMSITANEKLDLRFNSLLKLSNDTIRISSDVLLPAIDSGDAVPIVDISIHNGIFIHVYKKSVYTNICMYAYIYVYTYVYSN